MFDKNRCFVPVDRLEIGMFISDLDRPWLGTPFLIQGFEITSKEQLQKISDICEYVYVDKKKSGRYDYNSDEYTNKPKIIPLSFEAPENEPSIKYHRYRIPNDKYSVEEELINVEKAYEKVKNNIHQTLERLREGYQLDVYQSKKAVNICVESIFNNKDSLLWFTLIKKRDPYTSEHSLNVTIFSIAFARYLGHSEDVLKTIGLCGLLHDVGKVKIPLEVLTKEGNFTKDESDMMKKHPTFGRDYLLKQNDIDYEVVNAAYSHHERMDASGYPQGLPGSKIPYYARLIAIVDTYDAITNDRCYKKARTTLEAQKTLYKGAGTLYDEELVKSFIQWLGIYPPATIVEMTNGEVGIVLSVNSDWKTKPRVVLIIDENKQSQPQRIVDLYKNDLDRMGEIYQIKISHPNNSFGINLMDFKLN